MTFPNRRYLSGILLLIYVITGISSIGHAQAMEAAQPTSIPYSAISNPDEVMNGVMRELYGVFDAKRSCWISTARFQRYCMSPLKVDVVRRDETENLFVAVGGGKIDAEGNAVDCHGCSGALGLLVLAKSGQALGIFARNDLYEEIGAWGEAPSREDISIRQLGPRGRFGWIITTSYLQGGKNTEYTNIYGVYEHLWSDRRQGSVARNAADGL
jgi:hypothetical protein